MQIPETPKTKNERKENMKNTKRIASLLLALVMVFALAISVSASRTELDAQGSILIKDTDSVLASQKTFAAYKALDLKVFVDDAGNITTYEYLVPASLADFYAERYGLDKTAIDFIVGVRKGIEAEADKFDFAAAVAAAATEEPATGAAVEGGYLFSNLELGYYAIVDTTAEGDYVKPVSAVILDTITPNVEVEVKADRPSIDKNIDKDNDLGTDNDRVDVNNAAIGDTVTYVIESKVPEMTGYDKYFFIMHDQMSKGLTYNNNMVVTVGDKTLVENTDYILTVTDNEDGTTSLKIVFVNFLQYKTNGFVGKPVVVTYTALLNENAELYTVPNTNQVYLEYSANPSVDYAGENEPDDEGEDQGKEPLGETPIVEVETFTTTLEIVKTDALGNRLQGAEFTLTGEALNIVRITKYSYVLDENGIYWKLKDGSYTTTDPESEIEGEPVNQELYESLTNKYTKNVNVHTETTDAGTVSINGAVGEDGILRFEGMKAGTYIISELRAPDGYNILEDELTITITFDEENSTFTYGGGAVDSDGAARITVVNQIGSELPSTGGIGTTIFYVVGGILVLAAIVLLVTKKRMAVK
jgi:fimbrial isopeptide formation D2 family protein/LPXTG-motif cell wall-anchored protein